VKAESLALGNLDTRFDSRRAKMGSDKDGGGEGYPTAHLHRWENEMDNGGSSTTTVSIFPIFVSY